MEQATVQQKASDEAGLREEKSLSWDELVDIVNHLQGQNDALWARITDLEGQIAQMRKA